MESITFEMIQQAQQRLKSVVRHTDVIVSDILSGPEVGQVYIKTENLQKTGSFKVRGAYNRIAMMAPEQRALGVIAASAGNHAQGVALAARTFGIPATIVMPAGAPLAKVAATRTLGAEVVLFGESYDDACGHAYALQQRTGACFIHPFDDPGVIAGQGTIALEILEQLPETDVIIAPVGGGGLLSGIALAAKTLKPEIEIIGVEPAGAASMLASTRARHPVTLAEVNTMADGIAVKTPGTLTYELCSRYCDKMITVEEDEIASTILQLLEKSKIVSEGAGASSVAAILAGKIRRPGKNIVAVLSGGNIDVTMLSRIIEKGLIKDGRKIRIRTTVPDKPGQLKRLMTILADMGANVFSVSHDRFRDTYNIGITWLMLELETHDREHGYRILARLAEEGYKVDLE